MLLRNAVYRNTDIAAPEYDHGRHSTGGDDDMFLNEPEPDAAVQAAYDAAAGEAGYLMNYNRAWAWRQDVTDHFMAARKLVATTTTLSPGEIAVVNAAVAAHRRDSACSLAWGTKLARQKDAPAAATVLRGEPDGLSEREAALARWAAQVARDPNGTSAADIAELRGLGMTDREIAEATMLAVFRLGFSAYNAALGVDTDAELVADAPAEVQAAVDYGRPAEEYSKVAS
jgi:alkylhydroperoxidase family enzyme